ncbi:hypothetical protein CARUB_v10028241mg [Capsella rubella]|uniref:Uncharacterized protein n=1 Tax=Capsella rubella TaxID=81985 RepID=R0F0W5_9BRAS|nr:uncharacterized protein LOC17875132 [Capsella rubella]EOA14911.1 hypothetical protein CARUB_v10028241mg [Capsella rubella]
MNLKASQEKETKGRQEDGSRVVVETTDHRSSAGKASEQKNVEVVHEFHPKTSGGVLVGAAAAVESTLESAKEVISQNLKK